ncbi:MAG: acyltransferase [Bacteroidota bacterium]
MMPENQPRPRLWVSLFLNPWFHHKGRKSLIRRRTRMDVLPNHQFSLGNNSTIEDYATINNGVGDVLIGCRTRIGISNVVIGPVSIGDDVMLAPNVVISALNHEYRDVSRPISAQQITTDPIIIEDRVWVGANVVITAGVKIGRHAVVAAGSVVTKDVPAYSVVMGNPARVIKKYHFGQQAWLPVTNEKNEMKTNT